jgi:hypothetical protein
MRSQTRPQPKPEALDHKFRIISPEPTPHLADTSNTQTQVRRATDRSHIKCFDSKIKMIGKLLKILETALKRYSDLRASPTPKIEDENDSLECASLSLPL